MKKIAIITALALASSVAVATESQPQNKVAETGAQLDTQLYPIITTQQFQAVQKTILAQPSRRKVEGAVILDGNMPDLDGKVPELHSLPMIGEAFKSKQELEAPETIIIVTPAIVEENE